MPFEKDDEKTKQWGREGGLAKAAIYELDRMQLEKMRRVVDKDLEIIERIQNQDNIDPVDEKKLQLAQTRVQKYLDKLHATKSSLEGDPEKPLIVKIEEEIANKYANRNPSESNTG